MTSTAIDRKLRGATRPTWAEVSLSALRHNFRAVQQHVGAEVCVCAVVKADAYGHGAVRCALALQEECARWFGVTSLDEAIPLREAGIRGRILLMTGFWPSEEEELIHLQLTPTIWETSQIAVLNKAAAKLGVAQYPVHLKIDTGMGRLGAPLSQLPKVCETLRSSPHLFLEGVSTHFASSEVLDAASVDEQLSRFDEALATLRREGFNPTLVHSANSTAIISRPNSWYQMVRPGISLYGYHLPFECAGGEAGESAPQLRFKPALAWNTRILSLREVAGGQPLGYGGTYVTKAPARIAVLPVGYADGLNRQISSRGRVIVRDTYSQIVGRISMDLTLVDVTAVRDVCVGDEVILLGASGGVRIDAHEHARLANTIAYEILCNISKRVPRHYSE